MESNSIFKIAKLKIENFKCIDSADFNFSGRNLIVFDGPNGYGKTTAFDAIEILFTQTPRRIENDDRINAVYSYSSSPIHKVESKPISIQLTLENGKEKIEIKRLFESAIQYKSRDNNIRQIFKSSKLYINNEEKEIADLEEILEYSNLSQLFNVLNYVEQDENTFFLKKNPKEKYRELASLFGVHKELTQKDKVDSFYRKLNDLLSSLSKQKETIEEENQTLISDKPEEVSYLSLIADKDFTWDKENIEINNLDDRNSMLNEVNRIQNLLSNKKILSDILFLRAISKFGNVRFLTSLVDFYWSFQNIELLENENNDREIQKRKLNANLEILKSIESLNYSHLIDENTIKVLQGLEKFNGDIEFYKTSISFIISLRENLTIKSQVLEALKEKREDLSEYCKDNLEHINLKDSECPTCGYDWEKVENFLQRISLTEYKIFKEYNESNISLEEAKNQLKENFLNKIQQYLLEENEIIAAAIAKLIPSERYNLINERVVTFKNEVETFLNLFGKKIKDKIIALINIKEVSNRELIIEAIENIITESTPILNNDVNVSQLNEDFDLYFDSDIQKFKVVSESKIDNKKKYVLYQYYNSINKRLKRISDKELKLDRLKENVKKIKDSFDSQIKNYTKSIIDNISIPFYIYTGKILQEHSLGTGLVFDLVTDKVESQVRIRPIDKDQEVSYTLSSGQLSATIISLMLVLNKVYNTSKFGTLLIDDPLQTLDEINTHSLIEVLKHNFSNQQIILSTHEDRYSKFIRYKYDKFKLSHDNISMKEIV